MNILYLILISYLLGNISFSLLVSKYYFKKDIRQYGSKNAGTTNAARVFGIKFAVVVFIFDVLKGSVAVLIGKHLNAEIGAYIAAVSAVVGHNWPIIFKFKGGKGIATTIGCMLIINYQITIIGMVIGIFIAAVSKYMSLASVIAMIVFPLIVLFYGTFNLKLFIMSIVLSSLALFRHRENIKRLINGEENKLVNR